MDIQALLAKECSQTEAGKDGREPGREEGGPAVLETWRGPGAILERSCAAVHGIREERSGGILAGF